MAHEPGQSSWAQHTEVRISPDFLIPQMISQGDYILTLTGKDMQSSPMPIIDEGHRNEGGRALAMSTP